MLRRQYSRSPSQIRQSIDLIVAPRARQSQKRWTSNPADRDGFLGLADTPPILVKTGKRHGPGLIILGKHILSAAPQAQNANNHLPALIPITAFALGTWQIFRLEWKSKMIATFEDRLIRAPLPLPPHIDPSAIKEFDYRRVYATGRFRHDQEMLIGPRMHDGNNGYLVITPLEREGEGSTVLVNRGWIAKTLEQQAKRREGLPRGVVTVQGLLREPWKKNLFTPENKPEKKEFYFPDVQQMAALTGSQAVWIEETMRRLYGEWCWGVG